MVKKSKDADEIKLIAKINNRWEWLAYALKYRSKEILFFWIVILLSIIVLQNNGIYITKIIKSIWGGK